MDTTLAVQWGKLERMPKISLAKGERQRECVLTDSEAEKYLAACSQPWKDAATLILGSGFRPGEVFKLRWEHVLLNGHGGLIRVAEGKSRAARRVSPMVVPVYAMMKARHEAHGFPAEGWCSLLPLFAVILNKVRPRHSTRKLWKLLPKPIRASRRLFL